MADTTIKEADVKLLTGIADKIFEARAMNEHDIEYNLKSDFFHLMICHIGYKLTIEKFEAPKREQ